MNKTILVAAGMAIAVCTTTAKAATLFTSEMLREGGGTTTPLFCSVVNVGNGLINGTVEIIRGGSGTVAASTPVIGLAPGDIQGIGLGADPPNFPSAYFCRIDVNGPPGKVRGSLMLHDANGRTLVSIEAL